MDLALWIATGLLAVVALGSGLAKVVVPREKMTASASGAWARNLSDGSVKAIGVLELLAAVGLVLPAVLDIAPVMVPVTAVCWILLMIGAIITHGRLRQFGLMTVCSVYLGLAAFVAWGRFGPESFLA